ncbi:MAG TPA: replicative DNA helicase [Erysipelotrichaceae bacterium]|nr:replicative DNA helicase [Erysipelotrichaceae bacterium]
MNRQLPHSIEAEQSLLGAMLIYPSAIKTASESGLTSEDFFMQAHSRIFQAMLDLADSGKPVDATSLVTRLNDSQQLSSIGGADYILQIADNSVSSANVKYYAEMIQDKSYLRNLILTAQKIAEEGFTASTDLDDVMDLAEKQILDVTRNRRSSDFRNSREVVSVVMDNITKMSTLKSNVTGLKTAYRELDKTTNGLQRGDLIILAARPSMGKTAFALNLATQVARHNKLPVAIFSLEMPAEQLIQRMLSATSQVPGNQLRTGYLNNNEWNMLNEAATELKTMPIYIDDTPSIRVAEIFSKCRKLRTEHGLGLVLIDYIQLISGSSKNSDNRQQEVSEISRGLKALAREMKVPVIALSQLSRLVERREDKRPMLSDLRESGALEQDADIVMFLYRDDYYQKEKTEEKQEKVEVDIAKHRNGPTRKIELAFDRSINAFYNYASEEPTR